MNKHNLFIKKIMNKVDIINNKNAVLSPDKKIKMSVKINITIKKIKFLKCDNAINTNKK